MRIYHRKRFCFWDFQKLGGEIKFLIKIKTKPKEKKKLKIN